MKTFINILLLLLGASLLCSCGTEPTSEEQKFTMTATVLNVGEKLEVEVKEAEYASGIFFIIISDSTEIIDFNGNLISKADLKSEDTIRITYSGQIMMSYPPQTVAIKIEKI